MSVEAITYCEVNPMPTVPGAAGSGPSIPVTVTVTATGSTAWSTLGIPPGADVTVQLVGGGGGGANGISSVAGGGGGAAGFGIITVPAAIQAAGGTLVIGTGGAGGAGGANDGADGVDSTLTLDGVLRLTAGKGHKGTSLSHLGGAGGVVTTGAGVTDVVARTGNDGTDGSGTTPGVGGTALAGSKGKGGNGNYSPSVAAQSGTAGQAVISWSV